MTQLAYNRELVTKLFEAFNSLAEAHAAHAVASSPSNRMGDGYWEYKKLSLERDHLFNLLHEFFCTEEEGE